ncbi:hypothetical protein OG357_14630 [Streptomyces sp. NBC_01255]|uniref:hypothetical protein n=1 Tax=Streptomyces sp. NBC_01255 TaxID=2903798 RepID=UPI002E3680CD|nr:hypothetical protein [Streptomyces sp. NBC_01255]
MTWRNRAALASAALAVAAGLVGAAPAPASAAGCTVGKSGSAPWTGYAKCDVFQGRQYRVWITCQGPTGGPFQRYGMWQRDGRISSQRCSDSPNVGITQVRVQWGR